MIRLDPIIDPDPNSGVTSMGLYQKIIRSNKTTKLLSLDPWPLKSKITKS